MKKLVIAGVLALTASTGAFADPPSFTFVQVGYVANLGSGTSYDGFQIAGNYAFNENLFASAGFANVNVKEFGFAANGDLFQVGLGLKTDVSESSAVFAEVGYLKLKLDSNFASDTENGYQLGMGIRSNITKNIELKAAAYYQDLNGSDEFIQLGAAYNFTEQAAVFVNLDTDFDATGITIGARLSF